MGKDAYKHERIALLKKQVKRPFDRPILESEIREVQQVARSAAEAARLLGVSYNTYKKYAKLFGVFDVLKNPNGYGISKGFNISSGPVPLDDILDGKYPNYPVYQLKRRLLSTGYMEEKCALCGFEERRITDYKVPLALNHIDGNKHNHSYDNLQMLCLNCYFLTVGNLNGPAKLFDY